MSSITSSHRLRLLLGSSIIAALILATPVTGSAHPMNGTGLDPRNDWTNSHTLCVGCTVDRGNVVAVWQSVLFVDGYLARCGSSGIDGLFGSATRTGTRNWQQAEGLSVDGIVGRASWGRASAYLQNHEQVDSDGSVRTNVRYLGFYERVRLAAYRADPEPFPYGWRRPGLLTEVRHTDHPSISFTRC